MMTVRRLFRPAVLCALAAVAAIVMARLAGLHQVDLLTDNFLITPQAAVLVFLIWCGLPFARQNAYRDLSPSRAAIRLLRERWPMFMFPFLLTPIFNASYTMAKSSIPFLFGFRWENFLAGLDRRLFGQDPWLITHTVIGPLGTQVLSFFYTVVWGLLFAFVGSIVSFFASVETALRFHTSRMIVWMFGGVIAASFLSSAGPVFAQLSDPAVASQYEPLLRSLSTLMSADDLILTSQAYLRGSHGQDLVVRAGGISAMPSMHVATAALYVCLAWGTKWRSLALVFWATIWIGSIHFGYHYATDGLVGSLIAWLSWKVTCDRIIVFNKTSTDVLPAAKPLTA